MILIAICDTWHIAVRSNHYALPVDFFKKFQIEKNTRLAASILYIVYVSQPCYGECKILRTFIDKAKAFEEAYGKLFWASTTPEVRPPL